MDGWIGGYVCCLSAFPPSPSRSHPKSVRIRGSIDLTPTPSPPPPPLRSNVRWYIARKCVAYAAAADGRRRQRRRARRRRTAAAAALPPPPIRQFPRTPLPTEGKYEHGTAAASQPLSQIR